MAIRLSPVFFAATVAAFIAPPVLAVPLPVALSITDGEHAFLEELDGAVTSSGRVRSLDGATTPSWTTTWDVTSRDEGGNIPASGFLALVELRNLSDDAQHYSLELIHSLENPIRNGSFFLGSLATSILDLSGTLIDPVDDGVPFLSVTINDTVFFQHELDRPTTGGGSQWYFPEPFGTQPPPSGPPEIDVVSLRFAFELSPGAIVRFRTDYAAMQSRAIPEPATLGIAATGVILLMIWVWGSRRRRFRSSRYAFRIPWKRSYWRRTHRIEPLEVRLALDNEMILSVPLDVGESDWTAKVLGAPAQVPQWVSKDNVKRVRDAMEAITFESTDAVGEVIISDARALIGMPVFESQPEFVNMDGRGFSIAVLDTGVDPSHPFFGPDANSDGTSERIVYAYDVYDDDPDVSSYTQSHGTAVATIAAGSFDASPTYPSLPSFRGIAPGVSLIYFKVCNDSTSCPWNHVQTALQWVVTNAATYNVASVNISISDGENHTSTTTAGLPIWDELEALAEMDVIVVAGSGNSFHSFNSAQGVGYPAADENVVSVGAVWDSNNGAITWGGPIDWTTGPDRIASFSQRHQTLLDIFAPGALITAGAVNHGIGAASGTSMSGPHVASAAVLAQQLATRYWGRRITLEEFRDLIQETGELINDGDDENDNVTNTGLDFRRLDVAAMAAKIVEMGPPKVKDVVVRNTADVHGGYHVKDSDDTAAYWAQVASAPVGGGMNQVSIAFTEDVTVDEADLVVRGGGGFGGAYESTDFSYNSTNFTATWTFPTVMRDQLWLTLDATSIYGVRDADFNYLDGEWSNPTGYDDNEPGASTYPSGDGAAGGDFEFAITILTGDADRDGFVGLADLADLQGHLGTTSGAIWEDGDVTGDGAVTRADAAAMAASWGTNYRTWPTGGESLLGGGSGEEETMQGGGTLDPSAVDEVLGGGESLLTENPARIYFTLSGGTAGGGALPGSVPSAFLDGPGDSATLYVWANLGGYEFLNGYGLDIRATNENVVKATASTLYNANIVASNYGNAQLGVRWSGNLTQPALNPDGVGAATLAEGAAVFTLTSGGGLNSAYDGSDFLGSLDTLYDTTNGAFLVQSIALEALAGSGGLSTDIVLYIGDMAFSLDNTVDASYLTFGLGEDQLANNLVGETDGTAHATITVAAQGPSALVVSASRNTPTVAGTNLIGERRENKTRILAAAISVLRQRRAESLPAVDAAGEQVGSIRAARRTLVGSRAMARGAVAGVLMLDRTAIA